MIVVATSLRQCIQNRVVATGFVCKARALAFGNDEFTHAMTVSLFLSRPYQTDFVSVSVLLR